MSFPSLSLSTTKSGFQKSEERKKETQLTSAGNFRANLANRAPTPDFRRLGAKLLLVTIPEKPGAMRTRVGRAAK